jgi:hypothetical protein
MRVRCPSQTLTPTLSRQQEREPVRVPDGESP